MATMRNIYRARMTIRQRGNLSVPDFRAAQRRAMREFAPQLQRTVQMEASRRVKNSPSLTNRGRRRYPKTMADSYTANLIRDGRMISLTANTLRGRIFELGARRHWIFPRRGEFLWFRIPKPLGSLHRAEEIDHPGQKANPVMGDVVRALAPVGERILDRHIQRVLSG